MILAVAIAPDPGAPNVTLGTDVNPDPPAVIVTETIAPLTTFAVTVAPVPGVPNVTVGVTYPEPPAVTVTDVTEPALPPVPFKHAADTPYRFVGVFVRISINPPLPPAPLPEMQIDHFHHFRHLHLLSQLQLDCAKITISPPDHPPPPPELLAPAIPFLPTMPFAVIVPVIFSFWQTITILPPPAHHYSCYLEIYWLSCLFQNSYLLLVL